MDKDLERLKAEIKKRTHAYGALIKPPKKEGWETHVEAQARRLGEAIQGKFGCYEEAIVALVGQITGIKPVISVAGNKLPLPMDLVAIKINKMWDGHNYPIGQVAVFSKYAGYGSGITSDGVRGNWLTHQANQLGENLPRNGHWELATDKEIDALPEKQLTALMGKIIFVEVAP